ncbi:hypothetical protein Dsin_025063, partial [Dipteronia sinensis]
TRNKSLNPVYAENELSSTTSLLVMLRKRSRAVTSKQSLMAADHSCSQSSPTHTYKNPIPYFLVSPRFKAFTTKCLAESTHEVVNSSPTSTLDTKQLLSSFVNPFC